MAFANPNNTLIINGNLASDPKVFQNADGSKKVLITVAAQRVRKNAEGKREADFIQCEHFISKDAQSMGPYDPKYMRKGTQVSVMATVETGSYEKEGKVEHYMKFVVVELTLGYQPRGNESAPAGETPVVEETVAAAPAPAVPTVSFDAGIEL